MRKNQKAFTLIELLIVVAIIAILAAIAVPNFLEAQVRAKVSRVKNDLRAMATALESYRIEWNVYPGDGMGYDRDWGHAPFQGKPAPNPILRGLTTPVAYITTLPRDTFRAKLHSYANPTGGTPDYGYVSIKSWIFWKAAFASRPARAEWDLSSIGPDMRRGGDGNLVLGLEYAVSQQPMSEADMARLGATSPNVYDSTNGTISIGDIERVGP